MKLKYDKPTYNAEVCILGIKSQINNMYYSNFVLSILFLFEQLK